MGFDLFFFFYVYWSWGQNGGGVHRFNSIEAVHTLSSHILQIRLFDTNTRCLTLTLDTDTEQGAEQDS
jgi:hypothetical protein